MADTYKCQACALSYPNQQHLDLHKATIRHHVKLAQKEEGCTHACSLCFEEFESLTGWNKHMGQTTHRLAVKRFETKHGLTLKRMKRMDGKQHHQQMKLSGKSILSRDASSNSNSSSRSNSVDGNRKNKNKNKNHGADPSNQSTKAASSSQHAERDRDRSNSGGRFQDSQKGNRQDRFSRFDAHHEQRHSQDEYTYDHRWHNQMWEQDYAPNWNSGRKYHQNWYDNGAWSGNQEQYTHFDPNYNNHWSPNDCYGYDSYNGRGRGGGRGGGISRGGWRGGASGGVDWQQHRGYQSDEHGRSKSPPTKDTPTASCSIASKALDTKTNSIDDISDKSAGHLRNLSVKAMKIIDDIMQGGSGKNVTTKEVAKKASNPAQKSDDSSSSILDKAENLCKELRMKHQLSEPENKRKVKRAQEQQKNSYDSEIQQKEFNRPSSEWSSSNRNTVSTSDRSSLNHSKDNSRVSFLEEVSSSRSRKSSLHSDSTKSITQPKANIASSRQISSVRAPNTSGARRRVSESNDGASQESNILKLINAPRSRRERMEVERILTKYGKVIHQKPRPRLNFHSSESAVGEVDGQIFQLDELPEELRQEIAQLMQNEEIDEGSAITEESGSEMSIYDGMNHQIEPSKTASTSCTSVDTTSQVKYPSHTSSSQHATTTSHTVCIDTTFSSQYKPSNNLTSSYLDHQLIPPVSSKATTSPIVINDKDDEEATLLPRDDEDDCMVVEDPAAACVPLYSTLPQSATLQSTVSHDLPIQPEGSPHSFPNAIIIQPEGVDTTNPYSHDEEGSLDHHQQQQQQQQYISSYHGESSMYAAVAASSSCSGSPTYYQPHVDYYHAGQLQRGRGRVDDTEQSNLQSSSGGIGTIENMDHSSQDSYSSGQSPSGNKRRRVPETAGNDEPAPTSSTDAVVENISPAFLQTAKRQRIEGLCGVSQRSTMDEVLEISLREEEIHTKLSETEAAISSLEELLQKTQAQLNKRKYMKRKLQEEESSLRAKRLAILKGAVGNSTQQEASPRQASAQNDNAIEGNLMQTLREEYISEQDEPDTTNQEEEEEEEEQEEQNTQSLAQNPLLISHNSPSQNFGDRRSQRPKSHHSLSQPFSEAVRTQLLAETLQVLAELPSSQHLASQPIRPASQPLPQSLPLFSPLEEEEAVRPIRCSLEEEQVQSYQQPSDTLTAEGNPRIEASTKNRKSQAESNVSAHSSSYEEELDEGRRDKASLQSDRTCAAARTVPPFHSSQFECGKRLSSLSIPPKQHEKMDTSSIVPRKKSNSFCMADSLSRHDSPPPQAVTKDGVTMQYMGSLGAANLQDPTVLQQLAANIADMKNASYVFLDVDDAIAEESKEGGTEAAGIHHRKDVLENREKREIGMEHGKVVLENREEREIGMEHGKDVLENREEREIGMEHGKDVLENREEREIGMEHGKDVLENREEREIGMEHGKDVLENREEREIGMEHGKDVLENREEREIGMEHVKDVLESRLSPLKGGTKQALDREKVSLVNMATTETWPPSINKTSDTPSKGQVESFKKPTELCRSSPRLQGRIATDQLQNATKGKKKRQSRRIRDKQSKLPHDNESDSTVIDEEQDNNSSPIRRKRQNSLTSMVLKDYLHAESSSDVELTDKETVNHLPSVNNKSENLASTSKQDSTSAEKYNSGEAKKDKSESSLTTVTSQEDSTDSVATVQSKALLAGTDSCMLSVAALEQSMKLEGGGEAMDTDELSTDTSLAGRSAATSEDLWLEGGRKLYAGHTAAVLCMKVWGGFLITATADGVIQKYLLQSQQLSGIVQLHSGPVLCMHISTAGKQGARLFTGGQDCHFTSTNFKLLKKTSGKKCAATITCFSEWKGILYIGMGNGSIILYDLKSNQNISAFSMCSGSRAITCTLTLKEGGRGVLVVAAEDCSISVRDASSTLLLRLLEGHTKPPRSIAHKHNRVFSGGDDRTLQVHNINTGELLHMVWLSAAVIAVSVDKHYVAVGCADGTISLFNAYKMELECCYMTHEKAHLSSMLLADQILYVADEKSTVQAVCIAAASLWACKFGGCSSVFGMRGDLLQHIMLEHVTSSSSMQCLWLPGCCTETLNTQQSIEKHMLQHINESSKQCRQATDTAHSQCTYSDKA